MSSRDTVAVVGLGLMGGSLAKDLDAAGVRVLGWDADRPTLAAALESGSVDLALSPELDGIEAAEIVILATPVGEGPGLLEKAAPKLARASLVSDLGSTKETIVRAAEALGLAQRFVGSHPLVGDHRSGWPASRRGLYQGARVFLCPAAGAHASAIERAQAFWAALGARSELLTPGAHDRTLAWSSHLPQAVSSVLGLALSEARVPTAELGPGGRDVARLAGSAPRMWTDIVLGNRDHLLDALRGFERALDGFRSAVQRGDEEMIRALFHASRAWAEEGAHGPESVGPGEVLSGGPRGERPS